MTQMNLILGHYGTDLGHVRLGELVKLADAAKPFYDWVETRCRRRRGNQDTLSENLFAMRSDEIRDLVLECARSSEVGLPAIFDGVGRKYAHRKATFYFFAWILRDAPQQRLERIITRACRQEGSPNRGVVEAEAFGKLFLRYRGILKSFDWIAVREVLIDRLEGSRRAIGGRQREVAVRTAVAVSLQKYYEVHGSYGRFASIRVSEGGVRIGTEEFDVVVDLLGADNEAEERIVIPVKTRETEGGGHSHLFSRDINSAMDVLRASGGIVWFAVFIVAQSWSQREIDHVREVCDFTVALAINPTAFEAVDEETQVGLDQFVDEVLGGKRRPKLQL